MANPPATSTPSVFVVSEFPLSAQPLSDVSVTIESPESGAAKWCLNSLLEELDTLGLGDDSALNIPTGVDALVEPNGLLLVARFGDQPLGCGALTFHGTRPAEVSRLWVSAEARGLGIGRLLLTELEQYTFERGVSTLRLHVNRAQAEALALYRSAGYHQLEPPSRSRITFEKHLT
jgi:ribosomal protein S18 acetylase RimI-like enzyme